VVGLALLLTGVGIWRVTRLTLDGDMLSLLDPADPAIVSYRSAEAALPIQNALIVIMPQADAQTLIGAAKEVSDLDSVAKVLPLHHDPAGQNVAAIVLSSPASDIGASKRAIEAIRVALNKHKLASEFTGSPAFLVESKEALERDLRRAGIITLIAVSLFFVSFYRMGWLVVLAMLPIGVGIVWGLAVVSFTTRRLTLLAATVPTLLVGMGIDYCIHLVQATSVRLRSRQDKARAIADAWAAVARPLTVGMLTTAAAFLSLLVADLRGLRDMGWAGAATTLAVFSATMLLMPVLLSWCPVRWLIRESALNSWMTHLASFVGGRRKSLLLAGALITLFGLVGGGRVKLETDHSRLEIPDLPAKLLQERLVSEFGLSAAPFAVTFDSPDAAQRFSDALPKTPEATRCIAKIEAYQSESESVAVVHAAGNPFSREVYAQVMNALGYMGQTSHTKPSTVAGAPVVNARMWELLRHDWPRVIVTALVVITVVLTVGTAGLRPAVIALVPLACGIIWTGGIMGLVGTSISIMSAAVAPLVLGIGVDDGVHLLLRWRHTGGRLGDVYAESGVAIVATTVTTVAAFGAFMLSRTPALVQFGWQASVGLTSCLVAALFVLPTVCAAMGRTHSAEED